MDVFKGHMMKIARSTMKMICPMARVMGGMDHVDAVKTIGGKSKVPNDCDCRGRGAFRADGTIIRYPGIGQ